MVVSYSRFCSRQISYAAQSSAKIWKKMLNLLSKRKSDLLHSTTIWDNFCQSFHFNSIQFIFNIYRSLRTQQMSVLVLLCTSYTTCFGPYWWPSSGGFVTQKYTHNRMHNPIIKINLFCSRNPHLHSSCNFLILIFKHCFPLVPSQTPILVHSFLYYLPLNLPAWASWFSSYVERTEYPICK
jgi:hypothetical protein